MCRAAVSHVSPLNLNPPWATMAAYLLRRLWQTIPTLLGVVILVFFLFKWFGGDPAEVLAGLHAKPEQIQAIRQQLGLDLPVWKQLWIFLGQVITGDWGRSWATNEAVSHLLISRLPATLTVMTPILVLDVLLALPLALWVAYHRGAWFDRSVMLVSTVALSISLLVYVIVGQYVFAFQLGWFAVQGWSDSLWTNLMHYVPLPVLLVVAVGLAPQTRLYRSFFLDEMQHDHVRSARAKGLSESRVLWRHVLPNAWIPILTNLSVALPGIFVGSFLIESFFSIPGLGREVLLAVTRSDYPVIQAATIYLAAITMAVNLLTDVLYTWADPRVSLA